MLDKAKLAELTELQPVCCLNQLGEMIKCSFTNEVVVASNLVVVT